MAPEKRPAETLLGPMTEVRGALSEERGAMTEDRNTNHGDTETAEKTQMRRVLRTSGELPNSNRKGDDTTHKPDGIVLRLVGLFWQYDLPLQYRTPERLATAL
jgi:hypothetical protein